jgi:hypothetical protein
MTFFTRIARGERGPSRQHGGFSGFIFPVPGLPPNVGDAEVFNSDTIYAPGYNQFLLEVELNAIPLNSLDFSVITLDAYTQAPLLSDNITSASLQHNRLVFGANSSSGLMSLPPWLLFQIQVTSSGGVVGNNAQYRLYAGSV